MKKSTSVGRHIAVVQISLDDLSFVYTRRNKNVFSVAGAPEGAKKLLSRFRNLGGRDTWEVFLEHPEFPPLEKDLLVPVKEVNLTVFFGVTKSDNVNQPPVNPATASLNVEPNKSVPLPEEIR